MEETRNPSVYEMAKEFKRRHPFTIAWRLKKNSAIVQKHINSNEKIQYVFVGQKNDSHFDIISSCVVALTNQRILIGRDRVVVGYFLDSITPEMFNDLKVNSGVLWGKVIIDTVNELVTVTNISKSALAEIETAITSQMLEEKKKYNCKPRRHN